MRLDGFCIEASKFAEKNGVLLRARVREDFDAEIFGAGLMQV
ncbi:hypothetical protein [Rhodovarius crocodyli]|nr:hypothetical protein [Rhodovarius crocodyli]